MGAILLSALALIVGVVLLHRVEETNRRITLLERTLIVHFKTTEAALSVVRGLSEGKVLREAARRWEAPSEQPRIASLAKSHRPDDMRPLPARWLEALAEEAEA